MMALLTFAGEVITDLVHIGLLVSGLVLGATIIGIVFCRPTDR